MKNILTIVKKELSRVLKDRRLLLTVILLPGIMIYLMYSIMGNAIQSQVDNESKQSSKVVVVNSPDSFSKYAEEENYNITLTSSTSAEIETVKEQILENEVDLLIVFPEKFDELVSNNEKPVISTYYNPTENKSSLANQKISLILASIKQDKLIELDIDPNVFDITPVEVLDENKAIGKSMAMLLPFLMITFLFSAAMSVGPESIAGDKERGTMATLLITPTKRSEIAIAKITSLSILAVLSALSSFLGVILSIPKLMANSSVSTNIYGFGDYIYILLILMSTIIIMVGLVALISAYSKNVKEASMLVMPLFILSMVIGITTMFSTSAQSNSILYVIPIYNSVQVMMGIFSLEFNLVNFLITIISNAVISVLLVYALTRMFKSEKIMFSK